MTETEIFAPIIELITNKRKEQKLSQEELAARAGISTYIYRQFESHASKPTIELTNKIAAALGLRLTPNVLLPNHPETLENYHLPSDISPGETFYKWTVLNAARIDKFRHTHILCECECHTISFVEMNRIRQGKSTSCGHDRKEKIAKAMEEHAIDNPPSPKEDLRGQIFGNYLVLNDPPRKYADKWKWHCKNIVTGETRWLPGSKLKSGEVNGRPKGRQSRVPEDMNGMQFGYLKVLKNRKLDNSGNIMVEAKCLGCGRVNYYRATHLMDHKTLSCGRCAPKLHEGMTIDKYELTDEKQTDESGQQKLRCFNKNKYEYEWVTRERLLRLFLKNHTDQEQEQRTPAQKPQKAPAKTSGEQALRDIPELAGKRFGFFEVLKPIKVERKQIHYQTRCVVCGEVSWSLGKNLLDHSKISCKKCCPPMDGIYLSKDERFEEDKILCKEERKSATGLPEILCKSNYGNQFWINKEEALRNLADKLARAKQKCQKIKESLQEGDV